MSAMPAEPPRHRGRVHRIPRTVDGIGAWLSRDKRAAFLAEVRDAEQGRDLDNVLSGWYAEAMLDQLPDRDRRRARALDRRGAVALDDIAARRGPRRRG
ncbi:hypothetical protein BJF79_43160 [Actinomadura sp. CNU-125]|uniref:hypothetical protein n=1 Tax=Actinomadura sp. CNU-125 TaxID=1904961 RepID=UPI000962A81B|nr:hypothetical protein [Actinomadura sp. CNU-125]OLT26687.1 hypothetical protein BJF79_43160 [Actinomadura sp. CNU-125]